MKAELFTMLLDAAKSEKSKALLTLNLLSEHPAGIGDHSTEDFYNATVDCLNDIEKESKPHLIECMCLRWKDHVGVGDARDLNYRNEKEVDEAITNDDLLSLEKKLPKSTVNAIKLKVDRQINNAVRFAEDSDFPEANEIHDNVYG